MDPTAAVDRATGPSAGRATVLERLATFPARLRGAATAAPPPPAGEWTPAEVVRHLVAVEEEVWHRRLDQLDEADLTDGPRPRWQHQEPRPRDLPDPSLEAALAAFDDRRAATVSRLRSLDERAWARSGDHETYGVLDVDGLVRLAIDHDDEHLASLEPT